MGNIFHENKTYTKFVGKTIPRPFSEKKTNLKISLDQQPEILEGLFLSYVQVEDYQNILKLTC